MNLDERELAGQLEDTEIAAYEDFNRAPAAVGSRLELIGQTALLICAATPDIFMMNRAIGFGRDALTGDEDIERIKQVFIDAGARDFGIQVAPPFLTQDLALRLERHDFKRLDNWVKVVRGVEVRAAAGTDLRIEQVGSDHAANFARICAEGFGLPQETHSLIEADFANESFRHYMAFEGETPVATGTLMLRDGVGWLGNGATLASHRRRGAQSAIMARRVNDAIDAGCYLITTETGEDTPAEPNPSFHNMMRTGFRLAYARPNFIFRPGAPTH